MKRLFFLILAILFLTCVLAAPVVEEDRQDIPDCPICLDPLQHETTRCPSMYNCQHDLHYKCTFEYRENKGQSCPCCRKFPPYDPWYEKQVANEMKSAIRANDENALSSIACSFPYKIECLEEGILALLECDNIERFKDNLKYRLTPNKFQNDRSPRLVLGKLLQRIMKHPRQDIRDLLPDLLTIDGIPAFPIYKAILESEKGSKIYNLLLKYLKERPWVKDSPKLVKLLQADIPKELFKNVIELFGYAIDKKDLLELWPKVVSFRFDVPVLRRFHALIKDSTFQIPNELKERILQSIERGYSETDFKKLCDPGLFGNELISEHFKSRLDRLFVKLYNFI